MEIVSLEMRPALFDDAFGLPYDVDGEVAVPSGLAPVLVSTSQGVGV